jgi:hypothetical protein
MSNQKSITIKEINEKLGGKKDIYNKLNEKFYLPKLSSKGVTSEYLKKYIIAGNSILKLQRTEMDFSALPKFPGKVNLDEIMVKFNEFLKSKSKPPLGFEEGYNPNVKWLIRAIRHCDPHDEMKLFEKKENVEDSLIRIVDKEYINHINFKL